MRHVPPESDNVHGPSFDLGLLARRAAVDHHHRFTLEHGFPVYGTVASKRGARLLHIKPSDLERGHHLIANIDRRPKFHALRKIDAAWTGQLGPKHCGEQTSREKTVGDPLLEDGVGSEIVAQMNRVDVA